MDRSPVQTRVDRSKPPVQTRVDRTRPPVQTRVDRSGPPVQTRVDRSRPPLQTRVDRTQPSVQTRVERTVPPAQTRVVRAEEGSGTPSAVRREPPPWLKSRGQRKILGKPGDQSVRSAGLAKPRAADPTPVSQNPVALSQPVEGQVSVQHGAQGAETEGQGERGLGFKRGVEAMSSDLDVPKGESLTAVLESLKPQIEVLGVESVVHHLMADGKPKVALTVRQTANGRFS